MLNRERVNEIPSLYRTYQTQSVWLSTLVGMTSAMGNKCGARC